MGLEGVEKGANGGGLDYLCTSGSLLDFNQCLNNGRLKLREKKKKLF